MRSISVHDNGIIELHNKFIKKITKLKTTIYKISWHDFQNMIYILKRRINNPLMESINESHAATHMFLFQFRGVKIYET